MDGLKYGVLLAAIAGIVGCFLPLGYNDVFWNVVDRPDTLMVIGGYAVGAVMVVLAMINPPILRAQALVAAGGFGFVLLRLRDRIGEWITDGAIGAKLMVIAPMVGILFAVLAMWKAEAARR